MKRLLIVIGGAVAGGSVAVAVSRAVTRRRPAPRSGLVVVPAQIPPPRPTAEPVPVAEALARRRRPWFSARRILLTLVVLGTAGVVAGMGSYSAFSSTTTNTGNAFASGTVVISDNDSNGAMLSLSNAKPGDSSTGCIKVTYTGSLNAAVRMYATVTGTLAQYLTLTVTRGTNSSSYPSCAAFSADATDYIGAGAGIVYNGNLSAFASTWGTGLVDPTSWNQNDAHSYKFVVTVQDNNSAQGLSSTASFTWEARNN